MKKILWILLAMLCALGLASCGGGDDDDDNGGGHNPQGISGPAVLRGDNQVPYVQEISFDGSYIGDVAVNSYRDWSVPAGAHVVSGYDHVTGNSAKTYSFTAGHITSVRFFMRTARVAADDIETAKISEAMPE
jgi:hypothetical protein